MPPFGHLCTVNHMHLKLYKQSLYVINTPISSYGGGFFPLYVLFRKWDEKERCLFT